MAVTAQIEALLRSLTQADLDAMRPADRERLAAGLAHWAKVAAETPRLVPKVGILGDLKQGNRAS
jgi:hypothetical protein